MSERMDGTLSLHRPRDVTWTIVTLCRFCQHRWLAISGMVGFRHQVGSAPLNGWVSPSSQQIAFSRGTSCLFSQYGGNSRAWSKGSLGFVAINNAENDWTTTFMTGLPKGSYCNVVDGASVAGGCTGAAYVDNPATCTETQQPP